MGFRRSCAFPMRCGFAATHGRCILVPIRAARRHATRACGALLSRQCSGIPRRAEENASRMGRFPHAWRRGREAEGGGLLNRYRVFKPYRGFESLRLRQPLTTQFFAVPKTRRHLCPSVQVMCPLSQQFRPRKSSLVGLQYAHAAGLYYSARRFACQGLDQGQWTIHCGRAMGGTLL